MILLTGASGFLGKVILNSLKGYDVLTIGRHNADIIADLSKGDFELPVCHTVIHCAGKAHFNPKTHAQHAEFFKVNVEGTKNLLNALKRSKALPKCFTFISSVAVYGKETGLLINEDEPLLATDAYGRSKIDAEQVVLKWCEVNNVICTILRLPLVAGANPPGNLLSMINAISRGYYFNIDGGKAKKSIVLATDVAAIIIKAALIGGIYNLTDDYDPSIYELSAVISMQLNKKIPSNLPYPLARVLAIVGNIVGDSCPINLDKLNKITSNLTFDDSKAKELLGWRPTPVILGLRIN